MARQETKTKVEIQGAIVTPPQFKTTKYSEKPVCKLVFPIACAGQGELNQKPYWLQVVVFGVLAEQVAKLQVGQEVVCVGRIGANRWLGIDGSEKASQHIFAFRVGVVTSLASPIEWFAGAGKKQKVAATQAQLGVVTDGLKAAAGVLPHEVADFIGDGRNEELEAEAEAEVVDASDVPF